MGTLIAKAFNLYLGWSSSNRHANSTCSAPQKWKQPRIQASAIECHRCAWFFGVKRPLVGGRTDVERTKNKEEPKTKDRKRRQELGSLQHSQPFSLSDTIYQVPQGATGVETPWRGTKVNNASKSFTHRSRLQLHGRLGHTKEPIYLVVFTHHKNGQPDAEKYEVCVGHCAFEVRVFEGLVVAEETAVKRLDIPHMQRDPWREH